MHRFAAVGIIVMGALVATPANAEDETTKRSNVILDWGLSASVGGGVVGFTDEDTRDFADVGGTWEARVAVGTRERVAFEAAYIGGAQGVDALGLDGDAVLLSTGIEGNVRLNLIEEQGFQPYLLAGVGWKRYDVTNADFNTSSLADDDNVVEIPLGVGIGYRYERVIVDVRGMFRPSANEDLIAVDEGADEATLANWAATLRVGAEF